MLVDCAAMENGFLINHFLTVITKQAMPIISYIKRINESTKIRDLNLKDIFHFTKMPFRNMWLDISYKDLN